MLGLCESVFEPDALDEVVDAGVAEADADALLDIEKLAEMERVTDSDLMAETLVEAVTLALSEQLIDANVLGDS